MSFCSSFSFLPFSAFVIVGDQEYDGVIVRSSTQITAGIISAGKKLKVIGRAGVGVDNIDVNAATSQGVLVIK